MLHKHNFLKENIMVKITGSSAFKEATYNQSTQELTVTYTKGTYTYAGVTVTEVTKLQNATSKGSELRAVISGKQFTKVV